MVLVLVQVATVTLLRVCIIAGFLRLGCRIALERGAYEQMDLDHHRCRLCEPASGYFSVCFGAPSYVCFTAWQSRPKPSTKLATVASIWHLVSSAGRGRCGGHVARRQFARSARYKGDSATRRLSASGSSPQVRMTEGAGDGSRPAKPSLR